MELSDLTAYAAEKYRIQEQHKWTEFPGFSVLCHPQTGKWVALLIWAAVPDGTLPDAWRELAWRLL